MASKREIVIIGAGVIGCSIAYHLGKRGIATTIIEKESIGSRASGKAWAVISYPPALFGGGEVTDTYFEMPPGETVAKWQDLYWSGYYRMAQLALDIREKGNIDIGFDSVPTSLIANSEESEANCRKLMNALHDNNCFEYEWLERRDLESIFRGIHPRVRAGLTLPDFQLEPFKYTLGLAQAAEKMGAQVRHGDVVGFDTDGERIRAARLASGNTIEGDVFVIAMGPWSGPAASHLGQEIPAQINMEECLRIKVANGFPQHSIYGDVTIISRGDGELILASAEHDSTPHYFESTRRDDFNDRLTENAKERNIEAALELLPDLLEESVLVEHRGDLLAYGPKPLYQKPVLGRMQKWQNGYVATRFGGMGIQMSVGTGEVMADLIIDSEVPFGSRQMIKHLSPV